MSDTNKPSHLSHKKELTRIRLSDGGGCWVAVVIAMITKTLN